MLPASLLCSASGFARACLRAGSMRAVATFAVRPPGALLRDLYDDKTCIIQPSQRDATAAIARRQQWQTVPMEDAPRTLQVAMQEPCNEARIITEATYPYRVVFANHAWEDLCGWTAEEVQGKHGLSFLHGEQTSKLRLRRINDAVKYGERVEIKLVNYKKDGAPFLNRLRITPLTTSVGQYTHMLGILEELPAADSSKAQAAQQQQQQQQPRKLELQHL